MKHGEGETRQRKLLSFHHSSTCTLSFLVLPHLLPFFSSSLRRQNCAESLSSRTVCMFIHSKLENAMGLHHSSADAM